MNCQVVLVFQRNEITVSDVTNELYRVVLALQNMARCGGRHLQLLFQEKVGDGVVFLDVNLLRAENDAATFARDGGYPLRFKEISTAKI